MHQSYIRDLEEDYFIEYIAQMTLNTILKPQSSTSCFYLKLGLNWKKNNHIT